MNTSIFHEVDQLFGKAVNTYWLRTCGVGDECNGLEIVAVTDNGTYGMIREVVVKNRQTDEYHKIELTIDPFSQMITYVDIKKVIKKVKQVTQWK